MSMARKPDLVREMMDREQDNFERNQEKLKDLILKEAQHVQQKIVLLQSEITALEHKLRTLHDKNKWLQVKWHSFILRQKKRRLAYLRQITPSSKNTKEFLG